MPFSEPKSDILDIYSHIVSASHLRENERATVDDNFDLKLHVQQYVPKCNAQPREGDLTFICAGGIGLPKEIYQPFFEDLTQQLWEQGVGVRGFWIADTVQQGRSAVLNTGKIGSHISWFDHSRDLIQVIQVFKSQMPRPLIGIGHSMGGAQIAYLATLHPGLLQSMVLLDPSLRTMSTADPLLLGKSMAMRAEVWGSREEAVARIRRSPAYRDWDPRVLKLVEQAQLVPVADAPSAEVKQKLLSGEIPNVESAVATTTPRKIELSLILVPSPTDAYIQRMADIGDGTLTRSDISSTDPTIDLYRHSAPLEVLKTLPNVRSNVLYIVGEKSNFSTPEILEQRMKMTGSGVGGSGGVGKGKAHLHVVQGGGHHLMFDKVHSKEALKVAADHLVQVHREYAKRLEQRYEWQARSQCEQQNGDPLLLDALREWHPKKNPDIDNILKTKSKL